jgi:hypothetical protein
MLLYVYKSERLAKEQRDMTLAEKIAQKELEKKQKKGQDKQQVLWLERIATTDKRYASSKVYTR